MFGLIGVHKVPARFGVRGLVDKVICHCGTEGVGCRSGRVGHEPAAEVHLQNPALGRERAHHLVAHVALEGGDEVAQGRMRSDDWRGGEFDDLPSSLVGKVGDVDHHATLIEVRNQGSTSLGEALPTLVRVVAGVCVFVGFGVRQRDVADAPGNEVIHAFRVGCGVGERAAVLHAERERHHARVAQPVHVLGAGGDRKLLGMLGSQLLHAVY